MKIEKGQALVLAGPQGCGKSLLARKIAAEAGTYAEIGAWVLHNNLMLGGVLARQFATVIVEEASATTLQSPEVRVLLGNALVVANRRGHNEELVPAPNLIFCTSDVRALDVLAGNRRFRVVRVDELEQGEAR